jgi:hypothetical protein
VSRISVYNIYIRMAFGRYHEINKYKRKHHRQKLSFMYVAQFILSLWESSSWTMTAFEDVVEENWHSDVTGFSNC